MLVASIFILLSLSYFYNAFTEGLLLAKGDGLSYFYPIMSVVAEQYKDLVVPLWNRYIFSGFPLMASSQHGVFYPPGIILILLFPLHLAYNLDIVLHIAFAGFFTFLYARKIGNSVFPAFIAGMVFAFVGNLMVHLQHLSLLRTGVWLPLILYFFEELRVKADIRSALFVSLAIAMQIFTGHPQIYFYTWLTLFLYILFHTFYVRANIRGRFIFLSLSALALGLIIGSPQLFATYELSSLGVRPHLSYEVFSSHNFPLREMPSFIFQMGALPLLLAAAIFWVAKKSDMHVRFWGLVALISLILAFGDDIRPLNKLMFHVPLYNKFRGASKHLFEFTFAISILFASGISFILHSRKTKNNIATLIVLLFSFILISLISFFALEPSRLSTPAIYKPLAFMSVSLLCLPALYKRKYGIFKCLISAVVFFNVVSSRSAEWPRASDINDTGSGVFEYLAEKGDRTSFLVMGINSQMAMRHGLSTVEGYDPLVINDYFILLDMGIEGYTSDRWRELLSNNTILSLLNTRYVVISPRHEIYDSAYRKIIGTPYFSIYENLNCMSRAWSVSELLAFNNIFETKAGFYSNRIDPERQAVVSESDLKEIGTDRFAQGNVKVLKYEHHNVVLQAEFGGKGFVVLSDQYYPGWKAFIDGKPAKIYKTFGVLRGMVVPEGKHELSFRYLPVKIYILMALSILTVLGIIAVIILKKNLYVNDRAKQSRHFTLRS